MLGGEEEKDPDAQKKEEERQEALRQQEEERKAKHARMEAEREKVRQQIRDKVSPAPHPRGTWVPKPQPWAPLNPSSGGRPSSLSLSLLIGKMGVMGTLLSRIFVDYTT